MPDGDTERKRPRAASVGLALGIGLMPKMPLRQLIPNAITAMALCAGLTGMRMALDGKWEAAVLAVTAAALLDALDGRVARYLKGTSRFGAELDSLSDVVAFGVAPAMIIYKWSLTEWRGFGWVIALLHAVCCALRLARFNAYIDVADHPHKRFGFNTGVPAPAAAGLTLMPLMLYLWTTSDVFRYPVIVAPVVIAVAFLMVSNIATYSVSAVRLRQSYRVPGLIGACVLVGLMFTEPFATLSLVAVGYAATIVFSQRSFLKLHNKALSGAETQAVP